LSFSSICRNSLVENDIERLDLDTLTPLEALNLIHQWKKRIKKS